MGARSRTKGRVWEQEVARRVWQATDTPAARTLTECRDGNSGDITCAGLPLVIQCKVGARPDIYGAVEEAAEVATRKADYAVAIVKRNGTRHRPPDELAVLPLEDFLELIGTLKRTGVW